MRIVLSVFAIILSTGFVYAACGPDVLGTSRVMTVNTEKYQHFMGGEKSLGLRHKEVILTFDDGPIAQHTPRILNALKQECVKATFFYVGRMAKAYPHLVKRVVREGHTLAHHTYAHNRLTAYSSKRTAALVDKGIRALQKIAYGTDSSTPKVPFFRYPYLSHNRATDRVIARKRMVAFGANIDSLDWKKVTPDAVHERIMKRLREEGKGIILMHDIQARTADMLPRLLKSLRRNGYKIVHMRPDSEREVVPDTPQGDENMLLARLEPSDFDAEIMERKGDDVAQNLRHGSILNDEVLNKSQHLIHLTHARSREENKQWAQRSGVIEKKYKVSSLTPAVKETSYQGSDDQQDEAISVKNINDTPSKQIEQDRETKAALTTVAVGNAEIRLKAARKKRQKHYKSMIKKRRQKRNKKYVVIARGKNKRSLRLRRSQWILQ